MPLFQNAQNLTINGGNFNDFSTSGLDPLVYLEQYSAPGAMHDSMERYPPPRCHAETRRRALETIEHWGTLPRADRRKRLFWLHGPVGMGKTAIAQTIAEEFEAKGILGASFFFSRTDPNRDRAERFVASLALQLAISIPALKPHVGAALRANPAILRKALPIQLQKLIIEPFRKIPPFDEDKVVDIDGLDECEGSRPGAQDKEKEQLLILHLIETMIDADLPLNFFLASRPEAWIQEAFEDSPTLSITTQRMDLSVDSQRDTDIERYFRDHLERIRHSKKHRLCFSKLTEPWPCELAVEVAIHRASGQFAYIDVIIRYVDDPYGNPVTRLEEITLGRARSGLNAMDQLFDLYRRILEAHPNREEMRHALGCLLIPIRQRPIGRPLSLAFRAYDRIVGDGPGYMARALRGLHSLVRVPSSGLYAGSETTEDPEEVELGDEIEDRQVMYHNSLLEYLRRPELAGSDLHLDHSYYSFYFHYRCLVYLAKSRSFSPCTASSEREEPEIRTYAAESCPIRGWLWLPLLPQEEMTNLALDYARLFLEHDASTDLQFGTDAWMASRVAGIESRMMSSFDYFLDEARLFRRCLNHWRCMLRRHFTAKANDLSSRDGEFLQRLFISIHLLAMDPRVPHSFKIGPHEHFPAEPSLYFDNVEVRLFLQSVGLTKTLCCTGKLPTRCSLSTTPIVAVFTHLPADFWHLMEAAYPGFGSIVECAIPSLINRLWTDSCISGLATPRTDDSKLAFDFSFPFDFKAASDDWRRREIPDVTLEATIDDLNLLIQFSDTLFEFLPRIPTPEEIDFLQNPLAEGQIARVWMTSLKSIGVSVIVQCILEKNISMALALLNLWDMAKEKVEWLSVNPPRRPRVIAFFEDFRRDPEAFIKALI
ncbi:NWD2 [Coprinopsis cinerea okayama7|uniref:NWD2 n=1 Tax=Coprinopsis cinerea (strain Okayama-7 / 130 / ATCC MYA-4618 / FGSC 9003) TaxID=240176 RepID=A8N0S7_COPC7|nr:NWD2 [Coprinopsis cinerea okayama7\|eukprot:XP_001828478.2 NWD2 [Coprinopsis cinerea okayama7\